MKKLFVMLLAAMLCMSAVACTGTTTENIVYESSATENGSPVSDDSKTENTAEEETNESYTASYNEAMALIDEGNYTDAYLALKMCSGYAPAKEELKNFKSVYGKMSYPEEGEDSYWRYTYDEKGNMLEKIYGDEELSRVEWTYDENSMPLTEKKVNGESITVYTFIHNEDGTFLKVSEEEDSDSYTELYNSDMKLIKKYNDTTVIEYSYDEYGNMSGHTNTVDGELQKSIRYENEYDEMGNCVKITGYTADGEKYMEQINLLDDMGNIIREERSMYSSPDYDVYMEITEYSDYQLFYNAN